MDHNEAVRQAHDEDDLMFGTVESWLVYVRCRFLLDNIIANQITELDWRKPAYHRSYKRFSYTAHGYNDASMVPSSAQFLFHQTFCTSKDSVVLRSVRRTYTRRAERG